MPKPKIPSLPPPFDAIGRQIVVGLGKVASRAAASGAKSVVNDVKRVGRNITSAAEKTAKKLDSILNADDQDDSDEHTR